MSARERFSSALSCAAFLAAYCAGVQPLRRARAPVALGRVDAYCKRKTLRKPGFKKQGRFHYDDLFTGFLY